MAIVDNEQCVVGTTNTTLVVEVTHTTHSRQTRKHKGGCRVTCVLAKLRAHYTTPAIPQKERRKKSEEERKE